MKLKVGDVIEVFGCTWDEGWEFDAPSVLYRPFKAYSCTSRSIDGLLEDIFVDHAVDGGGFPFRWNASDLEEFAWRGWSPRGFGRRRDAWHTKITIRIIEDEGKFAYEVIGEPVVQRGSF